MADSDKNILITPNTGSSTNKPNIALTGFGNSTITLNIDDSATPSLEFSGGSVGSATTVFSIDSRNSTNSNTLLSVSGTNNIPVIETSTEGINIGSKSGRVTIGGDGLKLPGLPTSALQSAKEGTIIFDNTVKKPKVYNGRAWVIVSPSNDGSHPDCAGSSAEQIKKDYPNSQDGEYWILNNGVPELVYCDMQNGGWMYLIPPASASNKYPLNYFWAQSAGQTNCETFEFRSTSNWHYQYGYRCGTSSLLLEVKWKNYFDATRVRFSAIIGGGNTYYLTLNGTNVAPRLTGGSVYNRYWTSNNDAVSNISCSTNGCLETNACIDSCTPVEFTLLGDLTLNLFANSACQPDCNWGVSYMLSRLSVK